jgi:hypothetical protein
MPEAFVVMAVFAISVAAYVNGVIKSRDPSLRSPERERQRLQRHAEWLEMRLDTARREKWGVEMTTAISTELGATLQELGRPRVRLAEVPATAREKMDTPTRW